MTEGSAEDRKLFDDPGILASVLDSLGFVGNGWSALDVRWIEAKGSDLRICFTFAGESDMVVRLFPNDGRSRFAGTRTLSIAYEGEPDFHGFVDVLKHLARSLDDQFLVRLTRVLDQSSEANTPDQAAPRSALGPARAGPMAAEDESWDDPPWKELLVLPNMSRLSFSEECVVSSAFELGMVDRLMAVTSITATEMARWCACPERGISILLRCLTGLGLADWNEEKRSYSASDVLRAASRPRTEFGLAQRRRWRDLTRFVREGGVHRDFDPGEWEAFIHNYRSPSFKADDPTDIDWLRGMGLGPVRRLLDVGGGDGYFAARFLRTYPNMNVTLVDYAPAMPVAREYLGAGEFQDRLDYLEATFYDSDWIPPTGYDAAWIGNTLHVAGLDRNLDLLRRLRDALVPGGMVLIAERYQNPRQLPTSLSELEWFLSCREGQSYSIDEILGLLERAGFNDAEVIAEYPEICVIKGSR